MARVVVVGAGVIGSQHAYLAARAGHEVVQLEREPAARGASVRNFGLVWVSGRAPGQELALALRSRALWEELAAAIPGTGFRANGSLTVAQTDAEARVLEQVLERDDARERGFSLLDPDEALEVNPALRGGLVAALHCALDAAVEPRRVPAALQAAAAACSPRYRLVTGRHVVGVGDGVARDHLGEQHGGDAVVVCPGAAHRGFAGWDGASTSLRRVRLQMLETEPFGADLTTSIADGYSLRYYPAFAVPARASLGAASPVVERHGMQLLVQQRLDGSLTVGDTHAYDEPFDFAADEEPYRHLQERVESLLGAPMPSVRRRWTGVYSQSRPEVLYHAEQLAPRTWVVTGAGGRGMTLAPAIAEQMLTRVGLLDSGEAAADEDRDAFDEEHEGEEDDQLGRDLRPLEQLDRVEE
jgi:FAD dependent oxidoreductase TIGR03364